MAQTDKFRKGKSLFSTTLSSGIGTGTGETITLASVTGLPTDTEITLTIDRVDASGNETPAKLERITGTISGSNLTAYTRGIDNTSDQAHSAGAVIEYVYCGDDLNDLVDGILVGHTQAGLHDFNGGEVIIDTDGDTSMTADTDDQIDWKVGGSDAFRMKLKDFDLVNTDGNFSVNGADPWKTIWIPAGVLKPTTTNGCADVTIIEAGTNDIDYDALDFDASSDENAYANVWMPGNWDAGVIQFRYIWTNAAGLTTETVTFELSGRSFADNDAIDQAVGTPVEVADTWIAQGDIHISAWSGDVTITGAGAGELLHLELMRDVSEDDLTGDARILGIQIRYKEAQYNHF
jgi:hypothetical protein